MAIGHNLLGIIASHHAQTPVFGLDHSATAPAKSIRKSAKSRYAETRMGLGAKIGISIVVIMIGALTYGALRDLFGYGQYLATAIEVLILIWIWTRPTKTSAKE